MSSTLTELTVSTDRADALFLVLPDSTPGNKPCSSVMLNDNASYWNWSSKFPHLRKLVVKSLAGSQPEQNEVEINDALLSCLPLTIEHLRLAGVLMATHMDGFTSLHTLKVSELFSIPTWPPHLTRLKGPSYDDWDFKTLPRTLTTMPTAHQSDAILRAVDMLTLPPSLTSLKIYSIDWDGVATYLNSPETEIDYEKFWPRNLRRLEVHVQDSDTRNDARFGRVMGALPTSLTKLRLLDDWSDFELDWHRHPISNLKSYTRVFIDTFPTHLPTSLEHLELLNFYYQTGLLSFLQTSSLTALTLHMSLTSSTNTSPVQSSELFGCLPRTLKSFSLAGYNRNDSLIWTADGCSLLPTSLTRLSVEASTPPLVLHFLPPKLKKLRLTISVAPTVSDILAMPCYHHLRKIDFDFPGSNLPNKDLEKVWPEAALLHTTFGDGHPFDDLRNAVKARNHLHPDPRVLELISARRSGKRSHRPGEHPLPSSTKSTKLSDDRLNDFNMSFVIMYSCLVTDHVIPDSLFCGPILLGLTS